jgi:hypothetical protein
MKNIYIVSEDNHGYLAITFSYEAAIDFLIKDNWLPKEDEALFKSLYSEELEKYIIDNEEDGTIEIKKNLRK